MQSFDPSWQEESGVLVEEKVEKEKAIVVYNDDHNSFDHVINCLIKYCGHGPHQAGQCALIIHNKGKYAVKHGELDKLKPICEALQENGLDAKIKD